jgi:hypothetical protein
VPVIAAVEGRAHVHSEYALLANVIVATEDATFHDLPHFAGGIVPGDGIFTTWSYRAGAGRAEAFLLNPQPLTARTAHEWGVVAEIVSTGKALSRARELAALYLRVPEVTRRNTRVYFIHPLKERIVREVGYGLSLEGASAADLVKSMQAQSEAVAEKRKSAWSTIHHLGKKNSQYSYSQPKNDQNSTDRKQEGQCRDYRCRFSFSILTSFVGIKVPNRGPDFFLIHLPVFHRLFVRKHFASQPPPQSPKVVRTLSPNLA